MLLQFVPTWASEVDSTMKDVDGYYHGIVKQAIHVYIIQKSILKKQHQKDWTDLWQKEEYK